MTKDPPSLQQLPQASSAAGHAALGRPELPSLELLRTLSDELGLALGDSDLEAYREMMRGPLASFEVVAKADQPTQEVRYPRQKVRPPTPEENLLNAWYWKCSIKGRAEGPLRGKRVVVKDNICVAGVPMMNGSRLLEGYLPDVDATVVTRVLEAGAEIVGKGVCEHLSSGGSSFTSDTGPVRNPHDRTRSAGGSTSGPAALVASGEAELALGADQGGSIRIPSSWCGVYGLKATYGLVPYTGISSAELTQDHAGLMAANTTDLALLLEAVAGEDHLDPRQSPCRPDVYTRALTGSVKGLRVGVLEEGFGWPNASEDDVDSAVREAASRLAHLGAQVTRISVALHRQAHHIWRVINVEGRTVLMFRGRGMGTNWRGYYTLSLLEAYARGFRERAQLLSEPVKLQILLGETLQRRYDGRYYARAQNLALALRQAYDEALASVDVLLLPTTPMKATPLPAPDTSWVERYPRNLEMIPNTAPFNVTGHPALSIPCALSQDLPVGMMLVGRYFEESTLLRVAHAYEAQGIYPVGRPAH
jgi:amidase